MKITSITSQSNALLKKLRSLHQRSGRQKTGLFLIEGAKPLFEARIRGIEVTDVVVSESYWKEGAEELAHLDVPALSVVEDRLFKNLTTTASPSGLAAVARLPQARPQCLFAAREPLIVVCCALQDPGNLGTIIRTALAAGATGLILTRGTVDPYSPKVVRSAAGALFSLPIMLNVTEQETLQLLGDRGVRKLALQARGETPYFQCDLTGSLALFLGNEGHGFSKEVLDAVDGTMCIPMHEESESLNVAVTAGVILFSAMQQRTGGG